MLLSILIFDGTDGKSSYLDKFHFLVDGGGGVKFRSAYIRFCGGDSSKSDEFLLEKFSAVENEPIAYGDVKISSEESEALTLPPKFSLHEGLDLPAMDTEIKTSGVKMRWQIRTLEENEGEPVDHLKSVKETSHWWKGSIEVDF